MRTISREVTYWWESGDEFEIALRTYQARCFRIAFCILHDSDSAEEVVQLVFCKAFIMRFRDGRVPLRWETYLYQMAHYAAIDELRYQRRFVRLDPAVETWLLGLEASDYDEPETVWMFFEDADNLALLLARLPTLYHDIIMRLVIRQQSYRQIARDLDISVETARTRFHRAAHCLAGIVREQHISEGELRRMFKAYHEIY